MSSKNYTEVLIDGKIYTLGGDEDEGYLQRVASYINEKISGLKRQEGFSKQSADYQTAMVQLNIADDYFKAKDQIDILERQRNEMEKEAYSLKHELVSTQMKLEASKRQEEELNKRLEESQKQEHMLKEQVEQLRAVAAAHAAAGSVPRSSKR